MYSALGKERLDSNIPRNLRDRKRLSDKETDNLPCAEPVVPHEAFGLCGMVDNLMEIKQLHR